MAADPDLEPQIWRVWEAANLARCHLVPDALGGGDAPENLVLLCGRCHAEAPDVHDPEYMLRWITAHEPWGVRVAREVEAAIAWHEVSEDEISGFNELDARSMSALSRTLLDDWAVPVAGRFSYATLAACAVEMIRRAPRASACDEGSAAAT